MTADAAMPRTTAAERTVERAVHAFALAERWLFGEPMAELLDIFARHPAPDGRRRPDEELPEWLGSLLDGTGPPAGELSQERTDVLRRALTIEQRADRHFNFRTGDQSTYRERSQAVRADLSPGTRAEVLRLTDLLGLVDPRPPRSRCYETTLVLGGGYRSGLLRTRYAAQLQASGIVLGEISFLGSPRPLIEDPPERPVVESFAPGARDEFDLLIGAARTELGLDPAAVSFLCGCSSAEHACPNWAARGLPGADRTPAAFTHERRAALVGAEGQAVGWVLSASTGRPPLRPDTADTLRMWARCAQPRPGRRVLVVTTQVFVPFQAFDGVRRLYLPFGVDLDTVGYGGEWNDRPQTAEYLLQETLSAIRSARRLLVDAASVLAGKRSGD